MPSYPMEIGGKTMLDNITFGQFIDTKSVLHRLDPRMKIVLLIAIIVFIFLAGNFVGLGLITLFCLSLLIASKIPVKMYLKNLKVILPIIIFTAIINAFYVSTGTVLLDWWIFKVTTDGVARAVFMSARVVLLILISSALTYTTTPNDLTDAIERLLSPLKFIGLGNVVHMLAMMITIALRFIPTLLEETGKIMNAQKARGASFTEGKLLEKIKALIPILVPLLISSIRRAYELAEAMECRCYNGGEGRSRMKQLKLGGGDLFAFVLCAVICAVVVVLNFLF